MRAAFFTQLTIGDVSVETMAAEYLGWALGKDRFSGLRNGRLRMGVPPGLTPELLKGSGDYTGDHDCTLSVRRSDGLALVRLVHRDHEDGSVNWHNVIRLTAVGKATRIEHAIVRSAPRNVELQPRASSPRVVDDLIKAYSRGGIKPRDLYNPKATLNDGPETEDFVRHVLLDKHREVPVLLVTPTVRMDLVVEPAILAKDLRGMATVVELRSRDATEALTRAFVNAGFDPLFTCFDGGVRLYAPRMSPDDPLHRHRLWIRTWLMRFSADPAHRTALLAGLVADRIAEAVMPSDLITSVQDFDRSERRRHAERVLAAPPPDPGQSMESVLAQSTSQIAALEAALREATYENELYDQSNHSLTEQINEERKRVGELEFEAQNERFKAEALEQQFGAKQQKDADGVPPDVRAALAALLGGDTPPEVALRLIAIAWPERVVVLDSAHRSARKSTSFNQPDDVLDLLTTLVTEYYDAISRGGDNEARKVFGKNEFAPKESDSSLSKEGLKRRVFTYKNQPVEMLAHLKIGVKPSVAETLRIHFHWDAKDKKVVIGHCGPHLDFD